MICMSLGTNTSFVNQLIANQRNAIRHHFLFAIGIVSLGITLIVTSFLVSNWLIADGLKTIFSIGGGLVSSLSGFQLKEILLRKEKIGVFETVKIRLHELEIAEQSNQAERTRIEELLCKLVEKTAIG